MSERTENFIKTVGMLAKNEYLARDRWVLPSICIAQAALESGWNLNASTLFGIKWTGTGEAFTSSTTEYYNGNYVQIQDAFQKYPNVTAAVMGYYDFMTTVSHYAGAVNCGNYIDAINEIQRRDEANGKYSYATDPNYAGKIISIIEGYGLVAFDAMDNVENGNDESCPEENTETEYVVQNDDTLSEIAERFNTTYQVLAEINGIENPDLIYAGQVIKLPTAHTEENEESTSTICIGDSVRVLNPEQYSGGKFTIYYDKYEVMEVKGDRVVIGIDGEVTAAINICNLEKA